MEFHCGDIVRLRSGGPSMTVSRSEGPQGVCCVWFEGEARAEAAFDAESLRAEYGAARRGVGVVSDPDW